MKIVSITWVDSGLHYASSWLDKSTILQRAKDWDGRNITVGYLLADEPSYIVLVQTVDPESDNAAGAWVVWKKSIISMLELGEQND